MGYDHHSVYGAEPMCRVPPIATSTHYVHASVAQILPRLSPRTERRSIETDLQTDPVVTKRFSGSSAAGSRVDGLPNQCRLASVDLMDEVAAPFDEAGQPMVIVSVGE
jgi:hypothetical protein